MVRFWRYFLGMLFLMGVCLALLEKSPANPVMPPDFSDLLQPGTHREHFVYGDYRRKFICVTPEGIQPGQQVPLVFFLHGAGGTTEQALQTYGWAEKARAEGFIAVFPEGLGAHPASPGSFLFNPNIWRDGRRGQPSATVDDVGFFGTLLDQLEAVLPVDRRRIYVTGFSNGAAMTFTLGGKFADRIAAIAPVATQSFSKAESLPRRLPVYYLANMADPLVPFNGGRVKLPWGTVADHKPVLHSLEQWLHLDGCHQAPLSTSDHDGVHVETFGVHAGHSVIVFTTIDGNGHHWPGTVEPLPRMISGPCRDPINATDEIWKFFQEHPLGSS
jgi:polyhydroxybutyrate depolymerase